MCSLQGCIHMSQTGGCRTCSPLGLCFHRQTIGKTSVGISPPMTVRQNAFQIWAERWWVSLPVISCHSLVFPTAQRPQERKKIQWDNRATAVRVGGVRASVRDWLTWDDSVELQIEFTSCSHLLFISATLWFFFPLALESVVLNRGARSFSDFIWILRVASFWNLIAASAGNTDVKCWKMNLTTVD